MKKMVLLGVAMLCLASMTFADVLVLEDGEDPNLRDTYMAGGDGYWAESATSPVASPTTGNWAKFLYATGDNYWASFTKKNEYVPDDLSAYKNGALEMQLLWRENNFPAGWEFFILGDPGTGSTARLGFSLRNDGNTFGWGNDTWHKVSIDINNGLFDLAGGTVDGVAATFKNSSTADLTPEQISSIWSNVTGWQIVAGTGWTGWQAFGLEDVRLVPEPVSASLLGLGGLALIRRKR